MPPYTRVVQFDLIFFEVAIPHPRRLIKPQSFRTTVFWLFWPTFCTDPLSFQSMQLSAPALCIYSAVHCLTLHLDCLMLLLKRNCQRRCSKRSFQPVISNRYTWKHMYEHANVVPRCAHQERNNGRAVTQTRAQTEAPADDGPRPAGEEKWGVSSQGRSKTVNKVCFQKVWITAGRLAYSHKWVHNILGWWV